MKKIFTLIALCLGMSTGAWAETTPKVIYERGTNSENAWSAENLSDFTASWADLAVDNNYGATFSNSNNGSFKATKAIEVAKGSIINIDAYVELYSNTSAGFSQCAYFRFGNIYIGQNDQDKISRYSLDGMPTGSSSSFNHGTYRGGSSPIYHIQIEVNSATNTLNQLVVSNEDDSKTWVNISEATTLTNASYADVEFGFNKTTRTQLAKIVGLKSIKITETVQEVSTADYTINYKFEGSTIKSENGNTAVDNTVNAISPITIEGQKFYATSSTSMTIGADAANNVLNVTLRKANEYNYTVTSSTGATLATGLKTEDENVTIALPRYINVDGTLYETAKGSDWFHKTYTITQNNQQETVVYNATNIKNIVLYSEAEDLAGAIAGNSNGSRTSMGLTAYGTNLPVTKLAAGSYKIYVHGTNGNSAARAVAFKNGEDAVAEFTIVGSNNNQDFVSEVFTLTEAADITLTAEGSQASGVDFFYIQQIAASCNVSAAGYATFSCAGALDLDNMTQGFEAYKVVSVGDDVVTTEKVEGTVAAGTGLIIKGQGECTIPVVAEGATVEDNLLVATTGEDITSGYVLGLEGEKVMFLQIGEVAAQLAAGKAYLPAQVSNARALRIANESTGITNVATAAKANVMYNIAGQRVSDNAKGIVIVNGKKFNNK